MIEEMEYIKYILKRVKINCLDLHLIRFSWTAWSAILRVQGERSGALWNHSWLPTNINKGKKIQKTFPFKYFSFIKIELVIKLKLLFFKLFTLLNNYVLFIKSNHQLIIFIKQYEISMIMFFITQIFTVDRHFHFTFL